MLAPGIEVDVDSPAADSISPAGALRRSRADRRLEVPRADDGVVMLNGSLGVVRGWRGTEKGCGEVGVEKEI